MSILDEFLETLGASKSLDLDQTLGLILAKARRHTAAEAGSIFVVNPLGAERKELRACSLQNDRIDINNELFIIPINSRSIVGYVAETSEILEIDDLYEIDSELPYSFNRSFDDRDGYRSQSMLAFPLKNFDGNTIGVVQLLNHIESVDESGKPKYTSFSFQHIDDMKSIMGVIGALVERVGLIQEIKLLKSELKRHGVNRVEGSITGEM